MAGRYCFFCCRLPRTATHDAEIVSAGVDECQLVGASPREYKQVRASPGEFQLVPLPSPSRDRGPDPVTAKGGELETVPIAEYENIARIRCGLCHIT